MSDVALEVDRISKRYRIGLREAVHNTLAGMLTSWVQYPLQNYRRLRSLSRFDENGNQADVIWALRDVSFELHTGKVLGIIGRNGSGKSTLLKVLCRITEPTCGRAVVRGRIASLLEVGTGFHRELTGRENVYLNGTILGMSKREIDLKFDEIVAFSGVEKFIDTPVKRYSSGMRVRLAFAIAAHLDPEILMIDEVLAVGDAEFQSRCLGKMEQIAGTGRTILFVSHNMSSIQSLCSEAVLLDSGRIVERGDTQKLINTYFSMSRSGGDLTQIEPVQPGGWDARFLNVRLLDANDDDTSIYTMGDDIKVEFNFEAATRLESPAFEVVIQSNLGVPILHVDSRVGHGALRPVSKGGRVRVRIADVNFLPGRYYIRLVVVDGRRQLQSVQATQFDIITGPDKNTGKLVKKAGKSVIHAPSYWNCDYE